MKLSKRALAIAISGVMLPTVAFNPTAEAASAPALSGEVQEAVADAQAGTPRTLSTQKTQTFALSYSQSISEDGRSITFTPSSKIPAGATFTLRGPAPAGWQIDVNKTTGVIIATPTDPATASTGNFTIDVTFKGGGKGYVTGTVSSTGIIGGTDETETETDPTTDPETDTNPVTDPSAISYADVQVEKGQTVVVAPRNLPRGATVTGPNEKSGWRISTAEDGKVTIKAGLTVPIGDTHKVTVTVTKADGSKEDITFTATATKMGSKTEKPKAPIADSATFFFPAQQIKAGETVVFAPTGTVPEGATFRLDGEAPAGWKVSVDPASGKTTVIAPAQLESAARVSLPVTARYPDGSQTHVDLAVMIAGVDAGSPSVTYNDVTVIKGNTLTVYPKGLPKGATAKGTEENSAQWKISVLGDGRVTVRPTLLAKIGDTRDIEVTITFADGTTQDVKFTATAGKVGTQGDKTDRSIAGTVNLSYTTPEVSPGSTVRYEVRGKIPEKSVFVGPNETRDGWVIATDPRTGTVTVQVPADAKPGSSVGFNVLGQFTDGSTANYTITAEVPQPESEKKLLASKHPISYPDSRVPGGESHKIRVDGFVPARARFELLDAPEGWDVKVHERFGTITVTAPDTLGVSGQITVREVFPDGSSNTVTTNVLIASKDSLASDSNTAAIIGGTVGGTAAITAAVVIPLIILACLCII